MTTTTTLLPQLLADVIALARNAGDRLAAEFALPGGPRGGGDKAPIDTEIEAELRAGLARILPVPVIGEELPNASTRASARLWLLDPHDGTSAFLQGYRGSAVSIGLLENGVPVLGVVYAPCSPDRGPDMIAWAEGMDHILRNGVPVRHDLRQARLTPGAVVFLNHKAARSAEANAQAVAPARFVALPSIAYRMARVACGDGVTTLSFSGPEALDYAAGHALIRAAHGVFLDGSGREVAYGRDGSSHVRSCFAGGEEAARELLERERAGRFAGGGAKRAPRVKLGSPRAAEDVALDRAIGCLLGQLVGDSLGGLVEFSRASEIARRYPDGVRDLADGGYWHILAGQATDDSELALALARSLVERRGFDANAVATAYGRWYRTPPFDVGTTTERALAAITEGDEAPAEAAMAAANPGSSSNGSLMRVSPIGIAARDARQAAEWAVADSRLSHPNPACVASCAALAAAIRTGIGGGTPADMHADAMAAARALGTTEVVEALERAAAGIPPADFWRSRGLALLALQNAFRHLLHSPSPEQALIETVGEGGDTDTNGAIAGALLGAAHGRAAWPARWTPPVLACRPMDGLNLRWPRPDEYWPDDVPELAEALLDLSHSGQA